MKRRLPATRLRRSRFRCAVIILPLGVAAYGARAAESPDAANQPIVTLRDAGYLLGDLLDERVDFALPDGFSVDADSLPLPGRVAPWMEVRGTRSEAPQGQGRGGIVVTYQIFAEVEQASRVPIPPFTLRIRNDGQVRSVAVPEKSFLLSPALPPTLTDEDRELKPSPQPQTLPVGGVVARFVLGIFAALACAAYLLWAYDRLSFLPRSPGPFARAWRRWRRKGRSELSDTERIALLRDWHGALNDAARETLYASTLQRLFTRAPYLEPLRLRFEDLFARSWRSFYAMADAPAPEAGEVLELLRDAAARERGVPC
jgi:mxaA protein